MALKSFPKQAALDHILENCSFCPKSVQHDSDLSGLQKKDYLILEKRLASTTGMQITEIL